MNVKGRHRAAVQGQDSFTNQKSHSSAERFVEFGQIFFFLNLDKYIASEANKLDKLGQ